MKLDAPGASARESRTTPVAEGRALLGGRHHEYNRAVATDETLYAKLPSRVTVTIEFTAE